ncbi:MAG: GTP-binding protein [Alphaproteobacteria bacterium]|jgi:G3E family GTPase|nr:GTP-binding protein [Alphaproteobacteria bacterium]
MSTLPVSVITGFLGSGKTTLLSALLDRPEMADTAVVINEFGEVGLDHFLIENADENVVELASGCVCCTIRGDLALTLVDLLSRRREGSVAPFRRIVVETTGLADPAPILHMIMNDAALAEGLDLDAVITTVDAVTGPATLSSQPESLKQVAVADRLLVTKTDLTGGLPPGLQDRLRALNPMSPIEVVVRGEIAPGLLFGQVGPASRLVTTEMHGHHGHAHDDGIAAHAIIRDAPIPAAALSLWLETLAEHAGADLLRLKGLVDLRESPDRPAVIHGVQHVFHPPEWLEEWPSEDRRSRIVLITRDVAGSWAELLLDTLVAEVRALETRAADAA